MRKMMFLLKLVIELKNQVRKYWKRWAKRGWQRKEKKESLASAKILFLKTGKKINCSFLQQCFIDDQVLRIGIRAKATSSPQIIFENW